MYLDKRIDAALQDYVADHHGGVVNAALRTLVNDALKAAGYPRVLSQDVVDRMHRARRLEDEENHANELERRRIARKTPEAIAARRARRAGK